MLNKVQLLDLRLSIKDILAFLSIFFILSFLFKVVKREIFKIGINKVVRFLIFLFIECFSIFIIISSLITFYRTYMMRMLIVFILGIMLAIFFGIVFMCLNSQEDK